MIWSKSNKALESLLADSVKDHVRFHITRYGPGVSSFARRAWITWDGEQIAMMSDANWSMERENLARQLQIVHDCTDFTDPHQRDKFDATDVEANDVLRQNGEFSRRDFTDAVKEYLNLSIDDALTSENAIIRALAMFDRRLGMRRLKALRSASDDRLVRQFYRLRLEAEGIAEAVCK